MQVKMTTAEAVAALDALTGDNPARDHDRADEILLAVVPDEVRDAYHRLSGDHYQEDARTAWWAWA
jgi:hypothetical protein